MPFIDVQKASAVKSSDFGSVYKKIYWRSHRMFLIVYLLQVKKNFQFCVDDWKASVCELSLYCISLRFQAFLDYVQAMINFTSRKDK